MRDPQKQLLCIACNLRATAQPGCASQADKGPREPADRAETSSEWQSVLCGKLDWAVRQLQATTDVDRCIQLSVLIKNLAENVLLLRQTYSRE